MRKRFLLPISMLICTVMLVSACGNDHKTGGDSAPEESSVAGIEATESGSNSGEGSGETDGTGISVKPPEGWDGPWDSSGTYLVSYSNGTAHFWVEKDFIGGSNTGLDEMARSMKSAHEMSSVLRNVEFLGDMESTTVDGKDARKLVFNYEAMEPSGVKKMKRQEVFLIIGEDFYIIVFEDTDDHFDKLTGDFEQILESMSFN